MPGVGPVKAEISEYDRNFKWHQSTRQVERVAPFAGIESTKMMKTEEPPLQHKRRFNRPQDNNIMQGNERDDVNMKTEILLGGKKSEKFAPSIPHVIKTRTQPVSPPIDARTVALRNGDYYPTVDNGKPPIEELRLPEEPRHQVEERRVLEPTETKNGGRRRAPRFSQTEPSRKSQNPSRRQWKQAPEAPEKRRQRQGGRRKEKVRIAEFPVRREAPLQNENIPENYAKRHELGFKDAQRGSKANHLSEYRRQFEAHNGTHSSPILKAEDIIFRSHLDMPKDLKISDTTEYRQQFQKFRFAPPPKPVEDNTTDVVQKVLKDRRPEPRPAPPKVVVEGSEYGPREALNPQRMSFPLGRQRRFLSEYEANFRDYWHSTAPTPAHLLPSKAAETKEDVEERDIARKLWFEEILDLRRRAEEYKRRARGTHFSREHVAEILCPKRQPRKAWDQEPEPEQDLALEEERSSRSEPLTPRNETPEEEENGELTPVVVVPRGKGSASKHHLARTTPCRGGVILSPEKREVGTSTQRTESSIVVGKPRDISRSDNPVLVKGDERFSGLRSSSPTGPFLTAGKPTQDNADLWLDDDFGDDISEPSARGPGVIYEGFGQTYNAGAAPDSERSSVLEPPADQPDEAASFVTSSARSSSSARMPRVRQLPPPLPPPLPPAALREEEIDEDLQSTLESVRSIVSSSSLMAEETLRRAQRNQRQNFSGY